METVVLVMMILVCFNYILKQTYRKPYAVVFSAAVCALFTGSMWRYAVEQSKSQVSDLAIGFRPDARPWLSS